MKRNRAEFVSGSKNTFHEIIKKAYERGTTDTDITVSELLENIKKDLKKYLPQ